VNKQTLEKNMNEKVPKKLQSRCEEITSIIDIVCRKHLNDEYAEMGRKMTAALARKRPSPLESGRANTWACGIIYAVGFVNFLFDKSFPPYLSAEDLCSAFGVAQGTGYTKSKTIRDLFDLMQFDPRWTLPSLMDQNPMAWMISVNGLMIDARLAPRFIQEEAYRKGLIPYLPGERIPSTSRQDEPTLPFKVGECVAVKPGVQDPDFGGDMSGWQGRVVKIDASPPNPATVTIQWDSLTLQNMPRNTIERAEKEGLDWSAMDLDAIELERVTARDTPKDAAAAYKEIASHVSWLHLEKGGERIQKVLDGIDPQDEQACLEAWFDHLEGTLTFPFEAELTEFEDYGPIRAGDTVRVIGLNDIFRDYGILVDVKMGRRKYQLPLADLRVKNNQTPQYQVIEDYAVWFANR
jgi:hypothetical protein